jgi:hypothetical protein
MDAIKCYNDIEIANYINLANTGCGEVILDIDKSRTLLLTNLLISYPKLGCDILGEYSYNIVRVRIYNKKYNEIKTQSDALNNLADAIKNKGEKDYNEKLAKARDVLTRIIDPLVEAIKTNKGGK